MRNLAIIKKLSFIRSGGQSISLKTRTSKSPKLLFGFRKEKAEIVIRFTLLNIVLKHFKNPFDCIKVLKQLDQLRRLVLGDYRLQKIAKVDGRYYWDLYTPGCNSIAFTRFIEGEINRFRRFKEAKKSYTNVFLAITKKCSLKCEHCYEWDNLNQKEKLSVDDLVSIVDNLQVAGVGQIQLTGGEPLLRIKDLIQVMKRTSSDTEFWINTSGHKLTAKNASLLKANGLIGAVISLDHYDEVLHNQFRGNDKSYQWAIEGIKNAQANDIVTGLSICITKEFLSSDNLMAYANLGKHLGVSFIQILEPRAVGHYKGQNVMLDGEQLKLLEKFYLDLNYKNTYRSYPIITYHGYHQRKLGCFAGGNRSFYIDTDGDIHACPFCQLKIGSALPAHFEDSISALMKNGCHSFKGATT